MHEAGHAAHFANIEMPSPLFSQERAPTSVAYAELQSMFLDSLVSDADWMVTYAKSRDGESIPWDLVADEIEATHPYKVFALRGMIAVPYFEKALYEMDGDDPLMKLKGWRCCCDKPNRQFDNNRVTKLVNQISAAKDRSNQCRLFSVKKCGKVLTTTEENKWVTGGDLHYFEDTYVENPAEKSTCNLPAAKVQDIVTTVSAMKFFEAGNEAKRTNG